MGRYNHSLSLDATIIVSKNCPTIGEHVVTILVRSEEKIPESELLSPRLMADSFKVLFSLAGCIFPASRENRFPPVYNEFAFFF